MNNAFNRFISLFQSPLAQFVLSYLLILVTWPGGMQIQIYKLVLSTQSNSWRCECMCVCVWVNILVHLSESVCDFFLYLCGCVCLWQRMCVFVSIRVYVCVFFLGDFRNKIQFDVQWSRNRKIKLEIKVIKRSGKW